MSISGNKLFPKHVGVPFIPVATSYAAHLAQVAESTILTNPTVAANTWLMFHQLFNLPILCLPYNPRLGQESAADEAGIACFVETCRRLRKMLGNTTLVAPLTGPVTMTAALDALTTGISSLPNTLVGFIRSLGEIGIEALIIFDPLLETGEAAALEQGKALYRTLTNIASFYEIKTILAFNQNQADIAGCRGWGLDAVVTPADHDSDVLRQVSRQICWGIALPAFALENAISLRAWWAEWASLIKENNLFLTTDGEVPLNTRPEVIRELVGLLAT